MIEYGKSVYGKRGPWIEKRVLRSAQSDNRGERHARQVPQRDER